MNNNIDTNICPVCSALLTKDIVEKHVAYTFYIEYRRCGSFSFAEELYCDNELHNLDERQRAAVSYVIRRSQNLKHRRTLTTDDIREIARECYLPSPMEQVDNLIRWIGDSHPNPGETININVLKHRAIAGSITDFGLTFILKCMIEMKFADGTLSPYTVKTSNGTTIIKEGSGNIVLSLKGWDRFEELRRGGASGNAAFMAMKFGDQELDIILNNHFRNAVQRTGFQLKRLDDNPKAGLIDDKLRVEIKACRFLIADLTHSNLGAYTSGIRP